MRYGLRHAQPERLAPHRPAGAPRAPQPALPDAARPHAGTLAGAAARPPGRAVATQHSDAAALSDAPALKASASPVAAARSPLAPAADAATRKPNDPAAWGYAARSPTAGTSCMGPPALGEQLRAPQACRFSARTSRQFGGVPLNLFRRLQTKPCLGHCFTRGIGLRRQATILRLRGAVLFWRADRRTLPAERNSAAPAGLRSSGKVSGNFRPGPPAGICRPTGSWNFVIPAFVMARECRSFPMNHKGVQLRIDRELKRVVRRRSPRGANSRSGIAGLGGLPLLNRRTIRRYIVVLINPYNFK